MFSQSFSKGSLLVFKKVSEKTKENSEWLGQQARQGIEPGFSWLSVLSSEPLGNFWDHDVTK